MSQAKIHLHDFSSPRQFVASQFVRLARNTPLSFLVNPMAKMIGYEEFGSGSGLDVSNSERRQVAEGLNHIVMLTPPRGVLSGTCNATWNLFVSCVGPWVLVASCAAGRMQTHGPAGAVPGLVLGVGWGVVFALLAGCGCAQQLAFGVFNSLRAPYHILYSGKFWHPLEGCWKEHAMDHPDYLLQNGPSSEELFEIALERQAKRKGININDPYDRSTRLYQIIGVSPDATDKEIKEAYNKMALQLHPDRNPSKNAHEEFSELTKAYKVLSRPDQRRRYDAGGEKAVQLDNSFAKRDALRTVFGGLELNKLVGDVRRGRFARRMVDEVMYMHNENVYIELRQLFSCAEELRKLLSFDETAALREKERKQQQKKDPLKDLSSITKAASPSANKKKVPSPESFEEYLVTVFKPHLNHGLTREVLYLVGRAYLDVVQFHKSYRPSAAVQHRALFHVTQDVVPRIVNRVESFTGLIRLKHDDRKDPKVILDMVWRLSVYEIQRTARFAASRVLLDRDATPEQRQQRLERLEIVGKALASSYGCEYRGASKESAEKIRESLAKKNYKAGQAYQDMNRPSKGDLYRKK